MERLIIEGITFGKKRIWKFVQEQLQEEGATSESDWKSRGKDGKVSSCFWLSLSVSLTYQARYLQGPSARIYNLVH